MNRLLFLSLLALSAFSACKKQGDINISLTGLTPAGELPLPANTTFLNPAGRKVLLFEAKLYVTDLRLLNDKNEEIPIEDLLLFDLNKKADHSSPAGPEVRFVKKEIPAGTYNRIRFSLGLPKDLNESDATVYPAESPMSVTRGMYWDWATGYRFVILEGMFDPDGSGATIEPFAYHLGTESLLRTLDLALPNPIVIADDGEAEIALQLDINRIFGTAADPLDMTANPITHTIGTMGLATQLTENTVAAFSVKP